MHGIKYIWKCIFQQTAPMLWLTTQILIKNERMAPKTRNYSDKYALQHEYSDFRTIFKFSDYNHRYTLVLSILLCSFEPSWGGPFRIIGPNIAPIYQQVELRSVFFHFNSSAHTGSLNPQSHKILPYLYFHRYKHKARVWFPNKSSNNEVSKLGVTLFTETRLLARLLIESVSRFPNKLNWCKKK